LAASPLQLGWICHTDGQVPIANDALCVRVHSWPLLYAWGILQMQLALDPCAPDSWRFPFSSVNTKPRMGRSEEGQRYHSKTRKEGA